jgi:hypothetical protein
MTELTDAPSAEPTAIPMPDAPDSAASVETNAESTTAEPGHDDTGDAKPNGVQKRIAEITKEKHEARRAADRAEVERDMLREEVSRLRGDTQAQATPSGPDAKPRLDQFETIEDYSEAVADWKFDQRLAQREQAQRQSTAQTTFDERATAVRAKFADFDDVIGDRTLPISPTMAEVIRGSDHGPEVAYHLGQNRSEASRIASLSPLMQAAELGRIAATFAAKPTASPKVPPPPPPKSVNGIASGVSKDPGDMSMSEYSAWRKAGGGN